MSYVAPSTVTAGEFVDENDWNTLVNDMIYLNERLVPTGAVLPYGGTSAPTGWLLCQGQAVSRATYATLFAVIGTTYGAGDASTTFNVPNLQQRFPLGKAASGTGSTMGGAGGTKDAVVVTHAHTINNHTHSGTTGGEPEEHSHSLSNHQHFCNLPEVGDHRHMDDLGFKYAWNAGGAQSDYLVNGAAANRSTGVTYTDHRATGGHGHDGWSDIPNNNGSGGRSAQHSHGFGTGNPSDRNTDSPGVSGTDANLPPYVVLNYLIKS